MGIYVGVNGTPKEVTAVYVGVNGVPKECSDIYVGVNGTPKSCYSGVKPGETIFTSSTTFTVPKGVKKIDAFCVGGGGQGGKSGTFTNYLGSGNDVETRAGGGGGGGYTSTVLGADVTPGQEIPIVVGAGGSGGSGVPKIAPSSSVGDICSANGGYSSEIGWSSGSHYNTANGGSGGGAGGFAHCYEANEGSWTSNGGGPSNPGTNGTDGYMLSMLAFNTFAGDTRDLIEVESYDSSNAFNAIKQVYGKGQGTTTRYFGESTGTLYSNGGWGVHGRFGYIGNFAYIQLIERIAIDGIDYSPKSNTGNGGCSCNSGSSGICIIRWTKDYFK